MWSEKEDYNQKGQFIRLYQPIMYGRKPSPDDLTSSFIGGESIHTSPMVCPSCQNNLSLIAQLHVARFSGHNTMQAVDKTLQVYACNRATCLTSLFADGKKLHYGGRGIVRCRRINVLPHEKPTIRSVPAEVTVRTTENAWDLDDDGNGDLDDLEAKLSALETSQPKTKTTSSHANKVNKTRKGLPCYELSSLQEPPAVKSSYMDEDDVGLGGDSKDKIQQMLAKYMAEEEDVEILSALRSATGGGGRNSERDERLSAADRALLTFSDRLKRLPRQVIRYAYGGVPMWSIPVLGPDAKRPKDQKSLVEVEQSIPACPCGAPRCFEMQILPSILHILEVDKHVKEDVVGSSTPRSLDVVFAQGGMDFGNVAIYSCSAACGSQGEEFVVVQDSLDARPVAPNGRPSETPVVIQEGSKFDDDDDDDVNNDEAMQDEGDDTEDDTEDDG